MSLRTTPRTTMMTSGTTAFSTPALVRTADEKPRSRPDPIEPRPLETDQVIREIEEDINEIQSLESDMEPPPSLEDIKGSTKSLTFFVFFSHLQQRISYPDNLVFLQNLFVSLNGVRTWMVLLGPRLRRKTLSSPTHDSVWGTLIWSTLYQRTLNSKSSPRKLLRTTKPRVISFNASKTKALFQHYIPEELGTAPRRLSFPPLVFFCPKMLAY